MSSPESEAPRIPSLGQIGLQEFDPYLLNRVSARWNADMGEVLREHGLSTVRMRVLAVLAVTPRLSIAELAVFAVTEQSTLSRNLDAMEEGGLVCRTVRENDARAREIAITEAGRDLFDAVWPRMHALHERMFRGIDPDEHRRFTDTLRKVLRNVRVHDV